MKNMEGYYDFSGQKFGYPLSLSINGFTQDVFARQSSLEISYVLQGSYEAVTEHFAETIHARELIVIAPDEIHMLAKRQEDSMVLTIHIDFSRMADSMVGDPKESFRSGVFSERQNRAGYFALKRKIGALVQMLIEDKSNLLRLNVLMAELALVAASSDPLGMAQLPLQSAHQENYMKAIRYIDTHFREPLSLGDVAQQLSFSLSYTSKLLKKYTGLPFIKYLSYVRVRGSLEALLEGKDQIEQIALDCGMANAKAYTTTFKELYGVLPSAYRKQFQNNLRYSRQGYQKMELDEAQKRLFWHLLEEEKQVIYEDERLLLWKEGDTVCCQAKEAWQGVEVKPDGTCLFHLPPEQSF